MPRRSRNDRRVRNVPGIVTGVIENGFFLQDPDGDGDEATSDAVFVYTPEGPEVSVGDRVNVDGRVLEYYPGGEDSGNLSITQIAWAEARVVSSGHPLPAAVLLVNPPAQEGERTAPREVVEDDAGGGPVDASGVRFDPEMDALDFFETAGPDRVFTSAKARIDGSSIKLVSEGPVTFVRYNWSNKPDQGLVNGAGLPALPFSTDADWAFGWLPPPELPNLPAEYTTTANKNN